MGRYYQVGVLMVLKATLPSLQLANYLGRPIHHDDYHKKASGENLRARDFMAGVFTRVLRRPVPTEVSRMSVEAVLDAGRWIVHCPMGCRGAEMVSPADPIFLCLSCGSGEKWWPVVFPVDKDNLDSEVSKRADVHGWAWNVGETLRDLEAETLRLRGG